MANIINNHDIRLPCIVREFTSVNCDTGDEDIPAPAPVIPRSKVLEKGIFKRARRFVAGRRADEFHLFSFLPAELRIKIWKLSMPERVHELRRRIRNSEGATRTTTFSSNNKNPTVLQICSESRRIALEYYQICVRNHVTHDPRAEGREMCCIIQPFYFHPDKDTLLLAHLVAFQISFVWCTQRRRDRWMHGLFAGWKMVAIDGNRWNGITTANVAGGSASLFTMQSLFPDLEKLFTTVPDVDIGYRRGRRKLWSGNEGVSLGYYKRQDIEWFNRQFRAPPQPAPGMGPGAQASWVTPEEALIFLKNEYTDEELPAVGLVVVKRDKTKTSCRPEKELIRILAHHLSNRRISPRDFGLLELLLG